MQINLIFRYLDLGPIPSHYAYVNIPPNPKFKHI